LASSKGYDQIVNLLLEAGADKDMKDNVTCRFFLLTTFLLFLRHVLHGAWWSPNLHIFVCTLRLLLFTQDDKMALEWAIENGHDECAELLE
jgi:hypothetical protein